VRVPLAVKLPQGAHGGEVNGDLARLVDLAPTFLGLAGLPPAEGMSGAPLFDADLNPANAGTAYTYAENDFENNILKAVRDGRHALITANPGNPRGAAPVALYDTEHDAKELNNIAADEAYTELLQALTGVLDGYRRVIEENAPEPAGDAAVGGMDREQLEALGYL